LKVFRCACIACSCQGQAIPILCGRCTGENCYHCGECCQHNQLDRTIMCYRVLYCTSQWLAHASVRTCMGVGGDRFVHACVWGRVPDVNWGSKCQVSEKPLFKFVICQVGIFPQSYIITQCLIKFITYDTNGIVG